MKKLQSQYRFEGFNLNLFIGGAWIENPGSSKQEVDWWPVISTCNSSNDINEYFADLKLVDDSFRGSVWGMGPLLLGLPENSVERIFMKLPPIQHHNPISFSLKSGKIQIVKKIYYPSDLDGYTTILRKMV